MEEGPSQETHDLHIESCIHHAREARSIAPFEPRWQKASRAHIFVDVTSFAAKFNEWIASRQSINDSDVPQGPVTMSLAALDAILCCDLTPTTRRYSMAASLAALLEERGNPGSLDSFRTQRWLSDIDTDESLEESILACFEDETFTRSLLPYVAPEKRPSLPATIIIVQMENVERFIRAAEEGLRQGVQLECWYWKLGRYPPELLELLVRHRQRVRLYLFVPPPSHFQEGLAYDIVRCIGCPGSREEDEQESLEDEYS
ncbi:hypothetical protein BOTBODRAFT_174348 [Botryobasidium botryosum FD-172 SS1]|uniref:Uncharacterized protein n=1 Tax=Botryobasidium botryosum (strain FD-172 SS1) TaxID=930990 RepID=A0A067MGC7_BOTB1|nr:hypothetical protein BOTBODRAFT_174348 [Botryobasidium botryosum FD-172 SS1]